MRLDKKRLRGITEDLLACLGLQDRDVSIFFTDDKRIAALNRKCFGKRSPTNIISFSYLDGFESEIIGDLIISVERAEAEAHEAGLPLYERLFSLIIHGLLHVLGFHHENGGLEARRMRYRENRLLAYVTGLPAYKEII
ncbi:MAG: rRNA maturation RNase YbeY [Syntrophorhabdales bacterium]